MNKFGQVAKKVAESLATEHAPADYYLTLLDLFMSKGSMMAPDFIKDRIAQPDKALRQEIAAERMKNATPTGAEPKPEWATPKTKESAPIERPDVTIKKAQHAPDEPYISDPMEGVFEDAKAKPSDLPPIDAYEHDPQVTQAIHEVVSNPELHEGPPEHVEVARDIAAQEVQSIIAEQVVRTRKAAYLPQDAGEAEFLRMQQERYGAEEEAQPMRASSEVEAEYARRKSAVKSKLEMARKILADPAATFDDRMYAKNIIEQANSDSRADGMRLSAERRAATGNLTDRKSVV